MSDRRSLLRRGVRLAWLTVLWNVVEGVVAVAAGAVAGSVALVGFGMDSFLEVSSAVVVGWRLREELRGRSDRDAEVLERRAARIAGALLLLLAGWITFEAGRRLLGHAEPARESVVGLALTGTSLVLMPILARLKLRTAAALGSRALRADAYETIACAWLSLTTFLGLLVTALFGWRWADPAAALVLVPLIVREGIEGLRGDEDDD